MSQIQVKVGAPELPVPSTDAPDTGVFTGTTIAQQLTQSGEAAPMINMAVALIIPLIITIIATIIAIRKKRFSGFTVFNKARTIMGLLIIAALSTATTIGVVNYINENKQALALVETGDENTLTVEAEDVNINIGLEDEAVYKHVPANVVVKNATNTGYTLQVYASSSDLVSKDNKKIAGASQEGLDVLDDNTWGIALEQPINKNSKVFQGLPTEANDALTIKETRKATPANDVTTVYYGVYVTPDLPYGTYAGPTINYVAVANVVNPDVTIDFAGSGLLFEDNSLTNSVGYAYYCTEEAGYVGEDYEEFSVNHMNADNNRAKVITIEGADKLKVVVNYSRFSGVAIVAGKLDLEADEDRLMTGNVYIDTDGSGKAYTIEGDTVTILLGQSDSNNSSATFKVYPVYDAEQEDTTYEELPDACKWTVVQGEYKNPVLGEYQDFWGWMLEDADINDPAGYLEYITAYLNNYSDEIDMDNMGNAVLTVLNMLSLDGDDNVPAHLYYEANWIYYHLITYDGAGAKAPVCVKTKWDDVANTDICVEIKWLDKLTYKVRLGGNPNEGDDNSVGIGYYDEYVGWWYNKDDEEWLRDGIGYAQWEAPEAIVIQTDDHVGGYGYVLDPVYKGTLLHNDMDLPEVYNEWWDSYDIDGIGETTFYVVWSEGK